MVQNKLTKETLLERADELSFPKSVVQFMEVSFLLKAVKDCAEYQIQGQMGQPPYGFPEALRTKVLRGKPKLDIRPGSQLPPEG